MTVVSTQTPTVSANSPQRGPTSPMRGKATENASVANIRISVALFDLPLSKLLNSTTIGTLRRKNPAFMNTPSSRVSRETAASSGGRRKSPPNTRESSPGRAGAHWSARSAIIISAFSRRKAT